jgi:hypothetical protein
VGVHRVTEASAGDGANVRPGANDPDGRDADHQHEHDSLPLADVQRRARNQSASIVAYSHRMF